MPRVGSKVNNRKDRLKCMGNAVVPQCVAVIAECIKEGEDENNNN
jgi:site-specific DNA-cytosine methylase